MSVRNSTPLPRKLSSFPLFLRPRRWRLSRFFPRAALFGLLLACAPGAPGESGDEASGGEAVGPSHDAAWVAGAGWEDLRGRLRSLTESEAEGMTAALRAAYISRWDALEGGGLSGARVEGTPFPGRSWTPSLSAGEGEADARLKFVIRLDDWGDTIDACQKLLDESAGRTLIFRGQRMVEEAADEDGGEDDAGGEDGDDAGVGESGDAEEEEEVASLERKLRLALEYAPGGGGALRGLYDANPEGGSPVVVIVGKLSVYAAGDDMKPDFGEFYASEWGKLLTEEGYGLADFLRFGSAVFWSVSGLNGTASRGMQGSEGFATDTRLALEEFRMGVYGGYGEDADSPLIRPGIGPAVTEVSGDAPGAVSTWARPPAYLIERHMRHAAAAVADGGGGGDDDADSDSDSDSGDSDSGDDGGGGGGGEEDSRRVPLKMFLVMEDHPTPLERAIRLAARREAGAPGRAAVVQTDGAGMRVVYGWAALEEASGGAVEWTIVGHVKVPDIDDEEDRGSFVGLSAASLAGKLGAIRRLLNEKAGASTPAPAEVTLAGAEEVASRTEETFLLGRPGDTESGYVREFAEAAGGEAPEVSARVTLGRSDPETEIMSEVELDADAPGGASYQTGSYVLDRKSVV